MTERILIREIEVGDLHRLTFDPARDPALTARLTDLIGAPLPAPDRPSGTAPMRIWQGPHDSLIADLGARVLAVEEAIAGRAVLFGDAAAGLAGFDLAGDGLRDRLGPPPHPDGSRVMRLAGLRVTALWFGVAAARLFVDRSHADYMRAWLAERWCAQSIR